MKNNFEPKIPEDKESKKRSAIISLIIMILLLLVVFTYKWQVKQVDPVVEIAVLFDNEELPEPPEEPIVPKPVQVTSENSAPSKQNAASNKNTSATGKQNSSKYKHNPPIRSQVQSKESPVDAAPNSQDKDLGKEESKKKNNHNPALDNMLKNRNQGGGSDGENTDGRMRGSREVGNGTGTGTGDGTIGEGGRELIKKVPGTMGDSQAPKENPCSASGKVYFKYTVSKAGNVTSAYRSSGASDQCLINTGVSWIKTYVKANPGNGTAKGTYTIDFK